MKKKIVFALLLAGMSFVAPNVADACGVTSCGQSCEGTECYGSNYGVICKQANGGYIIKQCPRVVADV